VTVLISENAVQLSDLGPRPRHFSQILPPNNVGNVFGQTLRPCRMLSVFWGFDCIDNPVIHDVGLLDISSVGEETETSINNQSIIQVYWLICLAIV